MSEMKKVVLVIEASGGYGRGLLRGIARYSRLYGPWRFYRDFPEPDFYLKPDFYAEPETYVNSTEKRKRLKRFQKWGIDGVITRDPRTIIEKGIPAIAAIHLQHPLTDIPSVMPNNQQIGKMAAEHFLERGFRQFAFCGFQNVYWSNQRFLCFSEILAESGYNVIDYKPDSKKSFRFREDELFSIAEWLKTLPKSTALFVCNDDRAQQVADACRIAEVTVPDDVAILSVDNDELVCELADPPISSIELNSEQAGYIAAETLDKMMKNQKPQTARIEVNPVRVITRRSSDILAVADPDVLDALRYIRTNANKALSVEDVVAHVPVSRRVLERRFRDVLSRSILEEIRQVRARKIQVLLTETNMPMTQIASKLEFSSSKQICRLFQDVFEVSPMEYRKKYTLK